MEHSPYVTVYKSVSGWKPVLMSWTEDEDGGWYEPEQTAYFAHATEDEANEAAVLWAEGLEVPFRLNVRLEDVDVL